MSQELSLLEAVTAPEKLPDFGSFKIDEGSLTDQNVYIQSFTSLAKIVYDKNGKTFCYNGGYYADQLWKLCYMPESGEPYYMIENVQQRYHYLCLTGSKVDCCNIEDNDSRLWKIQYTENGYYRFVNKKHDAKLFLQKGGLFEAYKGPDYDDQLWLLVPENYPVVMMYALQYGGRLVGGSNPTVYRGNASPDQQWRIIPVEMGKNQRPRFFYLQNNSTGMKLFHDSKGKFAAYDGNNYPDQQWEVKENGGYFQFINRVSKGNLFADKEGTVGCYFGEEYPDQRWMLLSPNMKELQIKSKATGATLSLNGSDIWSLLPDLNGGYYIQSQDGGRVFFDGNSFTSWKGPVYADQIWNIISNLPTQPGIFEIVNTKYRGKMYSSDSSSITVRLTDGEKEKEQFYIMWANSFNATYNEDLIDEITDNNMFWLDGDTASVRVESGESGDDLFGFQGLDDQTEYLYRVCHPDEDIGEAIVCNDSGSTRTVSQYFSAGTRRIPSHFISTTASETTARLWAFYDMQAVTRPRRRNPLRIVQIRLEDVRANTELVDGCVNLNSQNVREHFISGHTARNYARSSREVLFQYRIPNYCYSVMVDLQPPPQPPRRRKTNQE